MEVIKVEIKGSREKEVARELGAMINNYLHGLSYFHKGWTFEIRQKEVRANGKKS